MTKHTGIKAAYDTMVLSFRADRKITLAVGAFVLLGSGTAVTLGLSQRWIVNSAKGQNEGGLLWAIALGAVAYALQLVGQRFSHNYRNDLGNRIQLALEQEITELSASIPTIVHLERGEYLNRITMLRRGLVALTNTGWSAVYAAAAILSITLSTAALAMVHPILTLLALCAIPILPLTNRAKKLQRTAVDKGVESLRNEEAVHNLCLNPDAAKEILIANNGSELSRRAKELWNTAALFETKARFKGTGGEISGWLLYFAALAAGLVFVGWLYTSGHTGLGDVILVISLAGQLRLQQQQAIDAVTAFADGGRVAKHRHWLLAYGKRTAKHGATTNIQPTQGLELRDVSFTYPGSDKPVLESINLKVAAGTSLGIVGLNGAGKSTLIKLLLGVHEPTTGQILIDGEPLTQTHPEAWASVCTGTLQNFLRLEVSVREGIQAGDLHDRNGQLPEDALREAAGEGLLTNLPRGLDTQLGRTFGGTELSFGQWQKIALARGLMRPTAALQVLDEPTAALDAQAEHDLFELFTQQARRHSKGGAIMVLVSHRFSTVHATDQIAVLSGGRLTEQGTHASLCAANGEYAQLYKKQLSAYQ